MKNKFAKVLGFVIAVGAIPVALAQTPDKPPMKMSEYKWPVATSTEPTDEEWDHSATKLEALVYDGELEWQGSGLKCAPRAVREWVRLECGSDNAREIPMFLGVLWGMAGDLSSVKANFTLASTLDKYKSPKGDVDQITSKMGTAVTTTFQVKPGLAFVVQLDELFWNENYAGLSVESRPGKLVDVSWAAGEKGPTILMR